MKRFTRVSSWEDIEAAPAVDNLDPATIAMANEETAEQLASSRASDIMDAVRQWIGSMHPVRSITMTCHAINCNKRPSINWVSEDREYASRLNTQLRLILANDPNHIIYGEVNRLLARPVLHWLRPGDKPWTREDIIRATRGVYLIAYRIAPELIRNQSLGALGVIWDVSREALSNQAATIFEGTGIAGQYNAAHVAQRRQSAMGNHSLKRAGL